MAGSTVHAFSVHLLHLVRYPLDFCEEEELKAPFFVCVFNNTCISSQTIVQKQYENLCTILSALRYIVNGSPTPTTGFPKFLSFGLPKKIRPEQNI